MTYCPYVNILSLSTIMRKPLKVQRTVYFFPLPSSSARTAAVSIRAGFHTALPIPTGSRRCSASDLPVLPAAKNQYKEARLPNFQICCWPLCYDFNGFGIRPPRSSPFFFYFTSLSLPFTFPSLTFTRRHSPDMQFSFIPVCFCTETHSTSLW